jgi:hypothetical protein
MSYTTVLSLNKISTRVFKLCSGQDNRRTDGRTDIRTEGHGETICSLFGEHKNVIFHLTIILCNILINFAKCQTLNGKNVQNQTCCSCSVLIGVYKPCKVLQSLGHWKKCRGGVGSWICFARQTNKDRFRKDEARRYIGEDNIGSISS